MFEMDQIELEITIEDIYANNQKKLRQICNREMARFGGISPKDFDGFYSRAGYEIAVAKKHKKYDPSKGKSPMEFLVGVIRRSVWKEMTDRNRSKRQIIIEKEEDDGNGNIIKKREYIPTVSIDSPIGDEDGLTFGDTLQSDFEMSNVLDQLSYRVEYSKHMKRYLDKLSKIQVKVLELLAENYSSDEIKQMLHIDSKLYKDSILAIKSYENTKCLAR